MNVMITPIIKEINKNNIQTINGRKNTGIIHHQLTLMICNPFSITNIITNDDELHPTVVVDLLEFDIGILVL